MFAPQLTPRVRRRYGTPSAALLRRARREHKLSLALCHGHSAAHHVQSHWTASGPASTTPSPFPRPEFQLPDLLGRSKRLHVLARSGRCRWREVETVSQYHRVTRMAISPSPRPALVKGEIAV